MNSDVTHEEFWRRAKNRESTEVIYDGRVFVVVAMRMVHPYTADIERYRCDLIQRVPYGRVREWISDVPVRRLAWVES